MTKVSLIFNLQLILTFKMWLGLLKLGADLGEGCRGAHLPPLPEMKLLKCFYFTVSDVIP